MAYNPWYSATYEHIREIANWEYLSEHVERKIVAVFSWMPQTIMAIPARGGGYRYQYYNPAAITNALLPHQAQFRQIRNQALIEQDIEENAQLLQAICDELFPMIGSVASSKYLHFSAPTLLPMWDREMRIARGHPDTPEGFLAYVAQFREELLVPENRAEALQRYPGNPVRGWDIVGMENR